MSRPTRLVVSGLSIASRSREMRRDLVSDVSFTVEAGEIVALVGASGSGKSLTCAAIQGVLPAGVMLLRGQALVVDQGVPAPVRPGRDSAIVMQGPRQAFNPLMTMAAHAAEVADVVGLARHEVAEAFARALADCGLDDPRTPRLRPFQMSGGMLQRAMMALALLARAPFLIADEVTSDLDTVIQAQILALMKELARGKGLGVLLVTHDMGVVASVADRILTMDHGRIVEEGPVAEVFDHPRHPATRRLIAAHDALYAELAAGQAMP